MKEKDFQSLFTKWLKDNAHESAAYELKLCKKASLPFSAVEVHQYQSLLDTRHERLVHKISDQSSGFKPFDCFSLYKVPAYLVILYYKRHKPKVAYCIDIDDFVHERDNCERKSITEDRAAIIATHTIEL